MYATLLVGIFDNLFFSMAIQLEYSYLLKTYILHVMYFYLT